MNRQSGFALMLVIWALVLMSLVAMNLAYSARVEVQTTTWFTERLKVESIADAAINRAIFARLETDPGLRWQADGRRYSLDWPNVAVILQLTSEAGKVDLNKAPMALLEGLFDEVFPGEDAKALAAAVVDWRDKDERQSAGGAEVETYRRMGRPNLPANRPFSSLAELSLVSGFDLVKLQRAYPYVTIHSRSERIDALSASPEVLAAVPGIRKRQAQSFVAARAVAKRAKQLIALDELESGRRYLETRFSNAVVRITVDIQTAEGLRHRESAVVEVHPGSARVQRLARFVHDLSSET